MPKFKTKKRIKPKVEKHRLDTDKSFASWVNTFIKDINIPLVLKAYTTKNIYSVCIGPNNNPAYLTLSRLCAIREASGSTAKSLIYSEYHYTTKIGRLVPKIFYKGDNKEFTDREIETISNHYHKYFTETTKNIEIWPPTKIKWAYLSKNYSSKAGPLGSSCMRHFDNQGSLKFYIKNDIHIVVKINPTNGMVVARALLWDKCNVVHKEKEYIMMDRVYFASEKDLREIELFAKQNDFLIRRNNTKFKYKNKEGTLCLIRDIHFEHINTSPYFDTMRFYSPKLGIVTNDPSPLSSIADDIKGIPSATTVFNPYLVKDAVTDKYIGIKTAINLDKYKGYIRKKDLVYIKNTQHHTTDDKIVCLDFNTKKYDYKYKYREINGKWVNRNLLYPKYRVCGTMEEPHLEFHAYSTNNKGARLYTGEIITNPSSKLVTKNNGKYYWTKDITLKPIQISQTYLWDDCYKDTPVDIGEYYVSIKNKEGAAHEHTCW